MSGLLPCPFCGNKNVSLIDRGHARPRWEIRCNCGGKNGGHETENQAIESWNKRKDCNDEGFAKGYQAALDDIEQAANNFYEYAREINIVWLEAKIEELKEKQTDNKLATNQRGEG
ncbi:Lar family restriction alleviation protein [Candidatus Parcubacteria bacterium]|nr:Lar family restriction alleviation protein [Candidatus Parcubacteria bacterium]